MPAHPQEEREVGAEPLGGGRRPVKPGLQRPEAEHRRPVEQVGAEPEGLIESELPGEQSARISPVNLADVGRGAYGNEWVGQLRFGDCGKCILQPVEQERHRLDRAVLQESPP